MFADKLAFNSNFDKNCKIPSNFANNLRINLYFVKIIAKRNFYVEAKPDTAFGY